MSILTDRVIFSGSPASNDLIHIVDVSDPTDNPAGTSFAIEVGDLVPSIPFTGLTTTGTTGPSTLVSGTLNVPEYSGGSGSIYTNDGTIGSGRIATLTDNIEFTSSFVGDTVFTLSNASGLGRSKLNLVGMGGSSNFSFYLTPAQGHRIDSNDNNGLIITSSGLTVNSTLAIDSIPSGTAVGNLGYDVSGNVIIGTTGGGGGVTIDPYEDVGNVTSITWDVSGTSTNYEATLTGDTTLNMTNVRNGDYGTLIVTQDGTGSHTLSFAGGLHKVVNGGGGAPTLTTNGGATDILSFTYNGSTFYWTVGNDYT